jgi:cAMP phosphodiesterase
LKLDAKGFLKIEPNGKESVITQSTIISGLVVCENDSNELKPKPMRLSKIVLEVLKKKVFNE